MLLVSFSKIGEGKISSGLLVNDIVVDLNSAYQYLLVNKGFSTSEARRRSYKIVPRNTMSLISRGILIVPLLIEIRDNVSQFIGVKDIVYKLNEVKLHAPIPKPGKLMCIALNYKKHVEETGAIIPKEPIVFTKAITSIIGPYDDIILPKISNQVDFEGELVIVIGSKCKYVEHREALNCVLGYTIANDVTARDIEFMGSIHQFFRSKSLDTFCPMGPGILLKEYVDDWRKFRIKTFLNGIIMQDSYVDDMIFGIEDLVSRLSQDMTLMPGDVILTGTPSGVGFRRKPPIFLKNGDIIEVSINGIGSIRNNVK